VLEALRPYGAERIYVFGSVARGEADELSDIDLVIIKETDRPFLERLREVARLLPPDIGGVDILVYSPEEFSAMLADGNAFAETVVDEGRLVYDRQAQDSEPAGTRLTRCPSGLMPSHQENGPGGSWSRGGSGRVVETG
jgi:predicted nucleotidyltransferase